VSSSSSASSVAATDSAGSGGAGGSGTLPSTTLRRPPGRRDLFFGRLGRGGLDLVGLVGRLLVVLARAGPERVLATPGEVRLEVVGADEILHVEERRTFEPDVDEGGLEPGQNPGHLAR